MVRISAALLAILLCACASSPPVQFLTLDPMPAPAGTAGQGGTAGQPGGSPASPRQASPLQVARVHIPATLDRQQIVRETSANVLEISDRHRWSAPLDQMIESVLTLDLSTRLPAGDVLPPRAPGPPTTRKVVLTIDRFMQLPGSAVKLQGAWSLMSSDDSNDHPTTCTQAFELSMNAGSASYADQVRAMSTLLSRLADSIAGSRGCP